MSFSYLITDPSDERGWNWGDEPPTTLYGVALFRCSSFGQTARNHAFAISTPLFVNQADVCKVIGEVTDLVHSGTKLVLKLYDSGQGTCRLAVYFESQIGRLLFAKKMTTGTWRSGTPELVNMIFVWTSPADEDQAAI